MPVSASSQWGCVWCFHILSASVPEFCAFKSRARALSLPDTHLLSICMCVEECVLCFQVARTCVLSLAKVGLGFGLGQVSLVYVLCFRVRARVHALSHAL